MTFDETYDLAYEVMQSIHPDLNLSLDEFVIEVDMTEEQEALCYTTLALFTKIN
jgi:hypothetical protein